MCEEKDDIFSVALKENLLRLYLNYYRSVWDDVSESDRSEGDRVHEPESE